MFKFILPLLLATTLQAQVKLSTLTRSTVANGLGDSALTLITDTASRSRASTIAQLRKSLAIKTWDSLKTSWVLAGSDPGVSRSTFPIQTGGVVWANGGMTIGSAVSYGWNGRSAISSSADGVINLQNNAMNAFALLNIKTLVTTLVTDSYSASITIDATAGNAHTITVTNGTAFTINAPTTPATGQWLEITIRNTSGGAVGTITWNAVFKMATFTTPATGNSRTIGFRYDGTNWVERYKTPADVPN